MLIDPRFPTPVRNEILKAEEALRQLNGKNYRFKPIQNVTRNYLITPKDINPFLFIALMISSFVLTDCICQSIFGE